MTETITIFCLFVLGGFLGDAWITRVINGSSSRKTVKLLAVSWGLIIAACAKFIIMSLALGLVATVITYFVGAVVSGPARKDANAPATGPLHEINLVVDDFYYKKEILTYVTVITYIISSVILFFVWR